MNRKVHTFQLISGRYKCSHQLYLPEVLMKIIPMTKSGDYLKKK